MRLGRSAWGGSGTDAATKEVSFGRYRKLIEKEKVRSPVGSTSGQAGSGTNRPGQSWMTGDLDFEHLETGKTVDRQGEWN